MIAKNMRNRMDALNIRQCELAEKVGVTNVSMSRYLSGARVPKAPILVSIARELQTTVEELTGTTIDEDAQTMFYYVRLAVREKSPQWTKAQKMEIIDALMGGVTE